MTSHPRSTSMFLPLPTPATGIRSQIPPSATDFKKIQSKTPSTTRMVLLGAKSKSKKFKGKSHPPPMRASSSSDLTDLQRPRITSGPPPTKSKGNSQQNPVPRKRLLDAIHRCGICGDGLIDNDGHSMRDNYLKYKRDAEFQRRKMEDGWYKGKGMGTGKFIKREDEYAIVAGTCGHLFHKQCLLQYCSGSSANSGSISSRGAKDSFFPSHHQNLCPRCNVPLMYSHCHEIDLESHRPKTKTNFDKSYDKLRIPLQTLTYKRDQGLAELKEMDNKIKKAREALQLAKQKLATVNRDLPEISPSELQKKLELCRKRRLEKDYILNYLDKSQRVIEFMQNQTPNMMRLYLRQLITDRPLDEIPKRTNIPRMLIPYLHKIAEDDNCLFALAQIILPRPYPGITLKFDDLLLGILSRVNPPLGQRLRSMSQRSGLSVLSTYDELFPDTCLQILRSYRDLRQAQSNAAIKDSNGNELAITIMYLVDDEEPGEENGRANNLKLPQKELIIAEKASDFHLGSSNGNSELVSGPSSKTNDSATTTNNDLKTVQLMQILPNPQGPAPIPSPPFSDNEQADDSQNLEGASLTGMENPESETSIQQLTSLQTGISINISQQKVNQIQNGVKSETYSAQFSYPTDERSPISSFFALPPLPVAPCPSVQESDSEEIQQQLKMLVVNPIVTEFDPQGGKEAVIQRQRLQFPRVDTQIQTEIQDTSSTTAFTTSEEEENEDDKFLNQVQVSNLNQKIVPPVKLRMECETQTPKPVIRLPNLDSATSSAKSHFQYQNEMDTDLSEFEHDPIVKSQVQQKISELCLQVDPPKYRNPGQEGRGTGRGQGQLQTLHPFERVTTPLGPSILSHRKVIDPLPPLPIPCEKVKSRTPAGMKAFLKATEAVVATPQATNRRTQNDINGNFSTSRTTKSKPYAIPKDQAEFRNHLSKSSKSKSKSKGNKSYSGGTRLKNHVADNIATAFRTPKRPGVIGATFGNTKQITTAKEKTVNSRKKEVESGPPSRKNGGLSNTPRIVKTTQSKSLNFAPKRNRQPRKSRERRQRANSSSGQINLEAKTGVMDIYSMLNPHLLRDLRKEERNRKWAAVWKRGDDGDGDEGYDENRNCQMDSKNNGKVAVKTSLLSRSRLINWRQNI